MELTISGISENPTTNGNLIVKLTTPDELKEILPNVFKKFKRTYYLAVDAKSQLTVGQKLPLDLKQFNVVERAFPHPTEGDIMLKWLHLK